MFPSPKFTTLALLCAVLALSCSSAMAGEFGECQCTRQNGSVFNLQVGRCDAPDCYNECIKNAGGKSEKCVTKKTPDDNDSVLPFAGVQPMVTISEAETYFLQKFMIKIPCDVCEATLMEVRQIPEAQCVNAMDNACTTLQKKFPSITCSKLVETLACGVARTTLANIDPAIACSKYAKCVANF